MNTNAKKYLLSILLIFVVAIISGETRSLLGLILFLVGFLIQEIIKDINEY
ncbi:p6 [Pineapple mealybug wilt-associated virus 2]|uniref:p6 n=1 Tax=Pineapple mealybug wilt-associated virus 2 TaxID=136234 RepID=Q9DQ83_9CLOS|nr:p6 [Pineapple mealybug wilt-associated virus 2]AAG13947.1 p6 [Pineapple mealybug wilt-associated virus 2]QJQ80351.1 p6 [Pineapple mealybug wilt-associated virus 2]QJQ80361.1 p6 [Pineapple mealybug wilt-associated virus 2]UOF87660.1 6 kDa protein [Pineapple mealybug wilt-associated virus 2]WCR39401.1 p6 [Pineapple mealybug wilt-associated virus 2]